MEYTHIIIDTRNEEGESAYLQGRVRDLHSSLKEEWGGSKRREKLKTETDK
jgi:hypothetical protein